MKYRLRIEIFFDAADSTQARKYVNSFLEDFDNDFGIRNDALKVRVHNVEDRRGGHLPVRGPWENKDDS